MATMNPLDSEGTYALPIAQMDRFLMKVNVSLSVARRRAGHSRPLRYSRDPAG